MSMGRHQVFEQCSKSKVCTSLKHCNCMFDNFTTCSVDEAQALQGSADLPGKVKGHCRHRVKGAPLRVVHIQPPKQLEIAQLLTIICTERPPLARMIQLLQPAVIARQVVMQHMMHRPWQDIVQQTACYDSLLQLTTVLRKIDKSARGERIWTASRRWRPSTSCKGHKHDQAFSANAL